MALGILSLATAVLLMALQFGWACRFARRYPPRFIASIGKDTLPRATVLLCVRGADPSLVNCLNGLFNQDYPSYDVKIIIDSVYDPSWDVVSPMLARSERPTVSACVLRDRQETCSLKVSALVQAIRELDSSTEVVALIDADVIPYRHWLRDLVQPLADPGIGATSGVRWYMPRGKSSWGTAVRSLWNAVAITQMYSLHIPWAGSMAFRADLFRKSEMLDEWARSFVEDTPSHRVLRSLGLRLCHVPAVTMVNHETIDVKDCFRFIRRQLLNARLYHESWPAIVAVSIGTPLALVGAVVPALNQLAGDGAWLAAAVGVALAVYGLGMTFALSWADRQINRLAQARGAAPYPYPWKTLLAALLTHTFHLACLTSASFVRRVEWRGITYEVNGAGRVRLLEYRPYQQAAQVRQAETSLV
jgi:hypothetical protein